MDRRDYGLRTHRPSLRYVYHEPLISSSVTGARPHADVLSSADNNSSAWWTVPGTAPKNYEQKEVTVSFTSNEIYKKANLDCESAFNKNDFDAHDDVVPSQAGVTPIHDRFRLEEKPLLDPRYMWSDTMREFIDFSRNRKERSGNYNQLYFSSSQLRDERDNSIPTQAFLVEKDDDVDSSAIDDSDGVSDAVINARQSSGYLRKDQWKSTHAHQMPVDRVAAEQPALTCVQAVEPSETKIKIGSETAAKSEVSHLLPLIDIEDSSDASKLAVRTDITQRTIAASQMARVPPIDLSDCVSPDEQRSRRRAARRRRSSPEAPKVAQQRTPDASEPVAAGKLPQPSICNELTRNLGREAVRESVKARACVEQPTEVIRSNSTKNVMRRQNRPPSAPATAPVGPGTVSASGSTSGLNTKPWAVLSNNTDKTQDITTALLDLSRSASVTTQKDVPRRAIGRECIESNLQSDDDGDVTANSKTRYHARTDDACFYGKSDIKCCAYQTQAGVSKSTSTGETLALRLESVSSLTPRTVAISETPTLASRDLVYARIAECTPRIESGDLSPWLCLPDELWLNVMRCLAACDLFSCMLTCTHLCRVASDPSLWSTVIATKKQLSDCELLAIGRKRPLHLTLKHCSGTKFSGEAVSDGGIARAFLHCGDRLVRLDVTSCMEPPLAGEALVRHAVMHCTSIRHLNVSWCNLSDSDVQVVCSSLPRLNALILNGCQAVTDASLDAIAGTLAECLVHLELFGCFRLTSKALVAMQRCASLEIVNIGQCYKLTDSSIASLVRRLARLRSLDIRGLKQTTDRTVAKLCGTCRYLRHLVLSNCVSLTGRSIVEIACKLDLQELDVSSCKGFDTASFSVLFTNCISMEVFDASSTNICSEDVARIADVWKQLKTLKLNFSSVSEASLDRLLTASHSLKNLQLYGCKGISVERLRAKHGSAVIIDS